MSKEDLVWVAIKAIGVWLVVDSVLGVGQAFWMLDVNRSFGSFLLYLLAKALFPGALGYYFLRDGGLVLNLVPGCGKTGRKKKEE